MLLLYLAFDKHKCSGQVLSLTALQVIVGNWWFLSVKHRDIRKVNEIIQLRAERTFITRFAAQIRDSRSILNACRTADKPESCRQEQDLISRRVCVRADGVYLWRRCLSLLGLFFSPHHTHPRLHCPHMENDPRLIWRVCLKHLMRIIPRDVSSLSLHRNTGEPNKDAI